ncbi:hypothetical protein CDAR_261971 [Caerostris darwini]|uniref:Uncharacterized protein n=1 Tax=Caerostris darwini TaxID=1538125 RepID=A0AAV4MQS2_9ARAC|nr:hypothetical protein CDAR_261971 [Caerostris darwini]
MLTIETLNNSNRIPSSIDLTVDQKEEGWESGLVNGLPFSYSEDSRKSLMELCPGETFQRQGLYPFPDYLVKVLARTFLGKFSSYGVDMCVWRGK